MVAGNKHLAVAGPPAELQQDDPWASFEGRAGGKLQILDSETGKPLTQVDLDAPPVWNGMAAAGGRLYVDPEAVSAVVSAADEFTTEIDDLLNWADSPQDRYGVLHRRYANLALALTQFG